MNKKLEYIGNYKVLNQVSKGNYLGYAVGSEILDHVLNESTSYRVWTVFTNTDYEGLYFATDGTKMYEVIPEQVIIKVNNGYVQAFGNVGIRAYDLTPDTRQAYKFASPVMAKSTIDAFITPSMERQGIKMFTIDIINHPKSVSNED